MSHQPGATEEVLDNQRPASTLRNLVFVVMVLAGLAVVGQGWVVVLEVYRNLGGTVLAWLVCGFLVLIGVFVLWGSVQALRWWDVLKRSPRKGELVAIIVVVVVAGAFGGMLGSSLDWRLHWTSGVSVEGKASEWEKTQGFLGWMLAVSAVVGVWTILAHLRTGQKKVTT
jgi:hypothetical protein